MTDTETPPTGLVERLQAVETTSRTILRGDFINRDGPEAAAELRRLETEVLDAAFSDHLDNAGSPLTWREVAQAAEAQLGEMRMALERIAGYTKLKPSGSPGSYQRGYDNGHDSAGLYAAGIALAALSTASLLGEEGERGSASADSAAQGTCSLAAPEAERAGGGEP